MPRLASIGALAVLAPGLANVGAAQNPEPPSENERPWYAPFTDNLRFTLDVASRVNYVDETGDFWTAQFVGFDLHKVFSNNEGDIGTLVLQGYLTRYDGAPAVPAFFESGDDWEFVYRIFNFNYTKLARNRFNIRVGHFELPFGLEQTVNTNGTLRDYMHGRNLGVKADWGAGVNGVLPDLEYEFTLSRGTGNEWTSRGDPYIVAGRIGSSSDDAWSFGVSGMSGDVSSPGRPGDVLPRWRAGIDVVGEVELLTLMGEVSVGEDDGAEAFNALGEIDWSSADESWLVYLQGRFFLDEIAGRWEDTITSALGVRWTPDTHWALSVPWTQDLATRGGAPHNSVLSVQVRNRF